MKCKNPFLKGVIPCGCRKCLPCRTNQRRTWAHRLLLEKESHVNASFVTLTYSDNELQKHCLDGRTETALPTLVVKDVQDFFKRLRKQIYPKRIRHFYTGEYGSITQRPHYHCAIFGFPSCVLGGTVYDREGKTTCCENCKRIESSWGLGRVHVGELTDKSAMYITKYVSKKYLMEDVWSKQKLQGRIPEFCRMSLGTKDKMGGIGAPAIKKWFTGGEHSQYLERNLLSYSDVPAVLMRDGSPKPLGKYLRGILREQIGRSADTPESEKKKFLEQLQIMREKDKIEAEKQGVPITFRDTRGVYFWKNAGKIRSQDKKLKIWITKEKL